MPILARPCNFLRVCRPLKIFLRKVRARWNENCDIYRVALFFLISKLLEMRHSYGYVVGILKNLNRYHLSRVCHALKIFVRRVREMDKRPVFIVSTCGSLRERILVSHTSLCNNLNSSGNRLGDLPL